MFVLLASHRHVIRQTPEPIDDDVGFGSRRWWWPPVQQCVNMSVDALTSMHIAMLFAAASTTRSHFQSVCRAIFFWQDHPTTHHTDKLLPEPRTPNFHLLGVFNSSRQPLHWDVSNHRIGGNMRGIGSLEEEGNIDVPLSLAFLYFFNFLSFPSRVEHVLAWALCWALT